MSQKLTADEVAQVIKARKILKARGLSPDTDVKTICQAAGGYGEAVERPEDLPQALKRALKVIETEKRQALINVICK